MAALTDMLPTTVAKVPHPVFVLSYEQKNITSDITPYVRSVTYTDYLSGQSDELEVELEDADGRWVRHWYPGKGDTLRKEAFELLSVARGINFIGNVEGRDIMTDTVDVVVTDGFTGNVVLTKGTIIIFGPGAACAMANIELNCSAVIH